jgi:1,4-alpha-glucan branching enzyme
MLYAFSENYILPISHDEVVHGKGALTAKFPGDRWQRLAGLRGLLGYMWAFPGKQLLFMGAELALEHEWSEQEGLFWPVADLPEVQGVQRALTHLNRVYRHHQALWTQDCDPDGLGWVVGDADSNVVGFVRYGLDGSAVACVTNFSPVARLDYPITLPRTGTWTELVNTDAVEYGGTGTGNLGAVTTDPEGAVFMQMGPLATIWLRHDAPAQADSTTPAVDTAATPVD